MQGDLIETLIQATDLPEDLIEGELLSLFQKANIDSGNIDIESLRKVLVDYLQDILPAAREALK